MTGIATAARRFARAALAGLLLAGLAAPLLASGADAQQARLQAGVLVCDGSGGWGLIIASTKRFQCTFSSANGQVREGYEAVISKYGIDIGVTGQTSLTWLVFGPADSVGVNYAPGTLAGSYAGVGADAAVGLGLGANVLVGGGPGSLALQPVSVQVQTGLSIAAGVQTLDLYFDRPLN